MKEDNPMSSKDYFRSGNSCLKRGLHDHAERLFRKGISVAGFDPNDYNPVTEEFTNPSTGKTSGGYLVQNYDVSLNYQGLSIVLYKRAVDLAKSEGINDRVKELLKESEEAYRKSKDFDINKITALRENYDFMQGLEAELERAA
jgi:hypothetical protein